MPRAYASRSTSGSPRRPFTAVSTALVCLLTVLFSLLPNALGSGTARAAEAAEACVPVAMGRYAGELTAAGQTACLELPLPQGARLAALTSRGGAGVEVSAEVVDATGTLRCDAVSLRTGGCELIGTAPFRARVHADDSAATGPYGVHFVRTDELQSTGCQELPAGSFADDTAAVRLDTGDGVFSHCLTIPAGSHSTAELLRVRYGLPDDTEEFPDYGLYLIGTDGTGPDCYAHPTQQQLKTDTLVSCSFTAGLGYTVLVEGQDAARTHTLNRRDVTSGAQGCQVSAATAVGAPARTGTSGENGTLRCHRITTGASTDRLLVETRDAGDTTHTLIVDDTGRIACYPRTGPCSVSGSTGYQVITQVPEDWSVPASYRLDAWRVATAAGAAAECPRAGSAAYGYGPFSGELTEERTGTCVALPTVSGDRLLGSSGAREGGAEVTLFNLANGSLCTPSASHACQTGGQSVLLTSLPDGVDRAAYDDRLHCENAPCGADEFTVDSVTPATAASGTIATLTVRGTALGLSNKILLSGGPVALTATTTWVSDDARTLKATVDLRNVPPGSWYMSVDGPGAPVHRGSFTVTPATGPGPGTYRPTGPTRLMDTRSGLGVRKGKVGPAGTVTLQVTGRAGIPATGVTAVVLNVTATGPTAGGFVSVYPDGAPRPTASNLNFTAGQTIPNLVVVPVVNGKVTFYNHSGSVDLLADVAGYYTTDPAGSTYRPTGPTRLMDTRTGLGIRKGKVGPAGTVTLQIAGKNGIPSAGVTAVVLNVTATGSTAGGFVSVYPDGTARPTASNLNFTAGQTIPNLVVVPVVNGKVTFYNHSGSVDLLADVAGYYTTAPGGSTYQPAGPTRLMDTRTGLGVRKGKVGPDGTVTLQITGGNGVPAAGVTAVVLNVTATAPTAGGFVSVYPDGTARPNASNLNFTAGQTIPNLVVVPVVNGKVSFYNRSGSVDLLADLAGYYTS